MLGRCEVLCFADLDDTLYLSVDLLSVHSDVFEYTTLNIRPFIGAYCDVTIDCAETR